MARLFESGTGRGGVKWVEIGVVVLSLQLTRCVAPGNIFNFPEPKIRSSFVTSTSHEFKRIKNDKGCFKP